MKMVTNRNYTTKLYPTLRMNVMLLHILCYAGLKRTHCWHFTGKYVCNHKKGQLKHWCACRDALYHVHSQSGMKFIKSVQYKIKHDSIHFVIYSACFDILDVHTFWFSGKTTFKYHKMHLDWRPLYGYLWCKAVSDQW